MRRNSKTLVAIAAAAVIVAAAAGRAHAQAQPVAVQPSVYQQLFPNPTGTNGYEYLVAAGDVVRSASAFNQVDAASGTLAERRRAAADPDAQQAIALLRKGLSMPIASPRNGWNSETRFPELSPFRQLARLLAMQQYVLLADGRVDEAIDCVRDGLALARAAQTEPVLIAGLSGIAMDSLAVAVIARHRDQLAVGDCDRLIDLLTDWLKSKPPIQGELVAEHRQQIGALSLARQDPAAILESIDVDTSNPDEALLRAAIAGNASGAGLIVDQAIGIANRQFATAIQSLLSPPWERPSLDVPEHSGLGAALFDAVAPSLDRLLDRYTEDRARIQLLVLHVAIRRYRWEHDRLPQSLDALKRDDLTIDPFTGKQFGYRVSGDTYDLYSAGAPERDDGAQAEQSGPPPKRTLRLPG